MLTKKIPSINKHFPFKQAKIISIACLILTLSACENEQDKVQAPSKTSQTVQANTAQIDTPSSTPSPLTTRYLSLASEQFETSCTHAKQLQTSIQLFLSKPNEKTLDNTKQQWLTSHNSYAASKLFRMLNIKHPELDHSQIDPVKHSLAIRIDQSPLLAGYLDAVEGYPQSGYVLSPLPINEETLNKEHQFSDTLYVTLGFHALEFLLWGENSEQARNSTDYAALTELDKNPELVQARRSQLLLLITKLLTNDLKKQCYEWQQTKGYYPSRLVAQPEEKQNEYIVAAAEQLLSDIQINSAQIKNKIEPHSAFAHSDQQDLQAQIKILKSLLESKEWKELSKKQERAKIITTSAKALLLQGKT